MPQEPVVAERSSAQAQAPEANTQVPARRRHYVNPKQPGITVFATTTVLDFVHVLKRPEMKDLMLDQIYRECRLARARLHGFVVMSSHVHLLIHLHERMNAATFMQRFKSESSKAMNPFLSPSELAGISVQRG